MIGWLTHSQVLRNSQTYLKIKPIWKVHFYLLGLISITFFVIGIWQVSQREKQDFSSLDPNVQNIQLTTHHTYIGEAESVDQILIFDLKSMKNTDDSLVAMSLLQKFNDQNFNYITQNNLNKTQINSGYQFGLVHINNSITYDIVENRGVITLTHSGRSHSLNLGF